MIEEETFPEDQLEVLGWCEDGTIMAVQHKDMKHIQVRSRNISAEKLDHQILTTTFAFRFLLLQGVQFHPESVICPEGMKIVQNFVDSL